MIQTFDVLKAQEAFTKAVVISVALGYNVPQTLWYIIPFWILIFSPYIYLLVKNTFLTKRKQHNEQTTRLPQSNA